MHMNKQTRIEYCEKEMQMKLNKICKFCDFATKIKAILFQTKKIINRTRFFENQENYNCFF